MSRQQLRITTSLLCALVLGVHGGAARAQEHTLGLGGEVLFTLRAASDLDKGQAQRADDCYDRLRYILNNPRLKAQDIQVRELGSYGAKIVANGQLIIPIGIAEAQAHGMTPQELAQDWAAHLRKVLPKLTARPDLTEIAYRHAPKQHVTRR
jgi:hypothetical protein